VGDWHPILAAVEITPAHWEMRDQYGNKYGDICLVRRRGMLGYRAMVLRPGSTVVIEVDFANTLLDAVKVVHAVWVRNHGVAGGPHSSWG
jgi:hypothetical protein